MSPDAAATRPPWWVLLVGAALGILTFVATFLVKPVWGYYKARRERPRFRVDGDPYTVLVPVRDTEGGGSQSFDFHPPAIPVVRMWVASVRLKNDPAAPAPASRADGIRARVTFSTWDGAVVLTVPGGRWGEIRQPDDPMEGTVELEEVSFRAGQRRPLNIAIRHPEEGVCYALDNQSFLAGNLLRRPERQLRGGPWRVKVSLSGVGVDQQFTFDLSMVDDALRLRERRDDGGSEQRTAVA